MAHTQGINPHLPLLKTDTDTSRLIRVGLIRVAMATLLPLSIIKEGEGDLL